MVVKSEEIQINFGDKRSEFKIITATYRVTMYGLLPFSESEGPLSVK